MTRRRLVVRASMVVLGAVLVTSCAETVVDVEADDAELDAAFDTAASTTLPISGSTAELLAEMSSEMSVLSSQIGDEGDEKETLRRLESIWVVAQPQVEATRPELVGGIDTTVEMARTAVVRIRPADADKAFQILTDLVDRYAGDG